MHRTYVGSLSNVQPYSRSCFGLVLGYILLIPQAINNSDANLLPTLTKQFLLFFLSRK